MENNQLNSPIVLHKEYNNSTYFKAQLKRVFSFIYRKSIYIIGKIGICPISKQYIGFYNIKIELASTIVKPSNTLYLWN